jgi:conjugal transfer pilus assembly protein TraB
MSGQDFINTNEAVKRRQNMLGFGVVIGVGVLVMVGMSVSDQPQQSEQKIADQKAEQVKQIEPNSVAVNPSQVWMAKSANQIDAIQKQIDGLNNQAEEQRKIAESLEARNREMTDALERSRQEQAVKDKEAEQPTAASVQPTNVTAQAFAPTQTTNTGAPFTPMQPTKSSAPVQVNSQYYGQPQQANTVNAPAQSNGYPPGQPNAVTPMRRGGVVVGELKKTSLTSSDTPALVKPNRPKAKNFLAPGTFTKATILTGAYAPTGGNAQQNPAPILFWVDDLSQMPNEYQGDIKGCMVLGSVVGDKTTERGEVRLMSLSCVNNEDEEVISQPMSGYAVGEDSMEGIRGEMIVRTGDSLTMAIMADVVGGFGRQLQYQSMQTAMTPFGQTSTIDPGKAMESGAGAGFGQAAQRLSQYYIRLAEDLFPVIEINALREVHLAITKGVDLNADYQEASSQNNTSMSAMPINPAAAAVMMNPALAGMAGASSMLQQQSTNNAYRQ